MAQQLPVYVYDQLESDHHIRLLCLHPGENDDPLRCTIIQIDLQDPKVEYEAISYVWGLPVFSEVLTVGETSKGDDQICITPSLHAAFRDLRGTGGAKFLWADGVCINQSDLAEKSRQIPLMTTIYTKASVVLIYTGPETDGSNQALDLVGQLQPYVQGELEYRGPREFEKQWPGLPPFADPSWTALRRLWKRPWSGRAWIGQEFALNQEVLLFFGSRSIPWLDLFRILVGAGKSLPREVIGDNSNDPDGEEDDTECSEGKNHAGALLGMVYLRSRVLLRTLELSDAGATGSLRLQDILQSCHHLSSTDPRDMIYAFVGISEDASSLNLTIDYDPTANPVRRLYCEVAANLLRRYGNLGLLSSVYSRNPHHLPSWVPDWSTFPDANRRLSKIRFYDSSAGTDSACTVSEDNQVLTLRGTIVDELMDVSEMIGTALRAGDFGPNDTGKSHLWLQEQIRRVQTLPPYPTDEPWPVVLSRTLVGNSNQAGEEAPDNFFKSGFQAVTDHIAIMYAMAKGYYAEVEGKMTVDMEAATADPALGDLAHQLDWWFENRGVAPPYINLVWISATQRCLGYTARGLIGLVPPHSKRGDKVVIFSGAKVPFVIRKFGSDGDDSYQLIGESYIHGIMKGEAVRKDDDSFWGRVVLK